MSSCLKKLKWYYLDTNIATSLSPATENFSCTVPTFEGPSFLISLQKHGHGGNLLTVVLDIFRLSVFSYLNDSIILQATKTTFVEMHPERLLSQILAMKLLRHNTSSNFFPFQYLLLLEKSSVKEFVVL